MSDRDVMQLTGLLQKLYRAHFGKMVSHLLLRYTSLQLSDAEDLVQEAFTAAAAAWPKNLPDKPDAWLYATIRNQASRFRVRRQFHVPLEHLPADPVMPVNSEDGDLHLLRLLFACMHTRFAAKVQLVTALRYVFGLQVQQIAELLGSEADSISKIIYRQRQQLKSGDIAFRSGFVWWSEGKVDLALKVLYVVFTEGWKIREERLCEDALSLTREVIRRARVSVPDAKALYALMLFQLSRWETRMNEAGELLELEKQQRNLWNRDMIRVATDYLKQASTVPAPSTYILEASIAYLHATAPGFAETPWQQIANLYEQLNTMAPSPFVQLNQAVALHFAGQSRRALHMLEELERQPFMEHHHLLHCSMARIYADGDNNHLALRHYRKALWGKPSPEEETFIHGKIKACLQAP
ncbi:RNA polymerase sigma factor [Chitinophaga barathri]|uniref:Sigma-70 family RNA polymerase sigma factor n=1 Tax=Chitinophaga barathri TaxID=1647451 RepID=A0A3N4MDF5_9BACT|nr:sigma-70 family RNA polymerase sigma factor [Chitinophaga barathri]RPD41884.1 sigma-70 family RNA polymerase sigma factor [Chitinophaga barathri]